MARVGGSRSCVADADRRSGLEGTGEIRLRDLVKEALGMRPSRVIVGEVRAEDCLDLLLALNAGLPGVCTLHANSAREALVKMCTLPLLAGDNALGDLGRVLKHRPALLVGQRPPGESGWEVVLAEG